MEDRNKRLARVKAYYRKNRAAILRRHAKYRVTNRPRLMRRWRKQQYKWRYGITIEERNQLIVRQGRKCLICPTKFSRKYMQQPVVDHDHETGVVRGILCRGCNSLLGYARDNAKVLKNAARYLETVYGRAH